jgi:hypothetical protein
VSLSQQQQQQQRRRRHGTLSSMDTQTNHIVVGTPVELLSDALRRAFAAGLMFFVMAGMSVLAETTTTSDSFRLVWVQILLVVVLVAVLAVCAVYVEPDRVFVASTEDDDMYYRTESDTLVLTFQDVKLSLSDNVRKGLVVLVFMMTMCAWQITAKMLFGSTLRDLTPHNVTLLAIMCMACVVVFTQCVSNQVEADRRGSSSSVSWSSIPALMTRMFVGTPVETTSDALRRAVAATLMFFVMAAMSVLAEAATNALLASWASSTTMVVQLSLVSVLSVLLALGAVYVEPNRVFYASVPSDCDTPLTTFCEVDLPTTDKFRKGAVVLMFMATMSVCQVAARILLGSTLRDLTPHSVTILAIVCLALVVMFTQCVSNQVDVDALEPVVVVVNAAGEQKPPSTCSCMCV